jgi:hypothetical protein
MKITRTVAAVGVAGVLGLTGIGAAVATSTAPDGTEAPTGLVAALRSALDGLVGDGTITDDQADAVAGTLAESDALGHDGHHGGRGIGRLVDLDVAASTLGLTTDELRTALSADGATLASVAADQGVETQALVDALVAAATERVEQGVTDGRLTREEADAKIADLPERVAAVVAEELRFGHGRGGHGPGRDDDTTEPDETSTRGFGRSLAPESGLTT